MYNAFKILWIVCFVPLVSSAEQKRMSLEEMMDSSSYEHVTKEVSFATKGPVHVECSYPILSGKGKMVEHVNQDLKTTAENRFHEFVEEEKLPNPTWEEECSLFYTLFPVYQKPTLISIGGCRSHMRDSRGCTYYEGQTFWQKENTIVKLHLDDLFIRGCEYHPFLLQYCETYFKSSGYGYYSSRTEWAPELQPQDLDVFVLTDSGLMIIFQAYTVGGWADGPDTVLIPYAELKKFIDPLGPLKEML